MKSIADYGAIAGKSDPETIAINDAAMLAALPSTWYGDGRDLGDRTVYVPPGDWHFGTIGRTQYDGEPTQLPPHLPGSCAIVGDGVASRVTLHGSALRLAYYTTGSQHNVDVHLAGLRIERSAGPALTMLGGSRVDLDRVHLHAPIGLELDGAQHVRLRSLRCVGAVGVRVGATTVYQANACISIDGAELLCPVGLDLVGAINVYVRNAYASGETLAKIGSVTGLALESCGSEASSAKTRPILDVVGNCDSLRVLGGVYAGGAVGRCLVGLAAGKVLRGLVLDSVSAAAMCGAVVEDPGGGVRGVQHRAVLIDARPDGTAPPIYAGPKEVAALDVAGNVAWRAQPGGAPYASADGGIGWARSSLRSIGEASRETRSARTEPDIETVVASVPLADWEGATIDVRAVCTGYDQPGATSWMVRGTSYRRPNVEVESVAERVGPWAGADVKLVASTGGVLVVLPAHERRRLWQVEVAVVRRPWSSA